MESINDLGQDIIHLAGKGLSRSLFLAQLSEQLFNFTECDEIEIRIAKPRLTYRFLYDKSDRKTSFKRVKFRRAEGIVVPVLQQKTALESLCEKLYEKRYHPQLKYHYQRSCIVVEDTMNFALPDPDTLYKETGWGSLALLAFSSSGNILGLIILKSLNRKGFRLGDVDIFKSIAETIGIAIVFRNTQFALNERVKELSCLHGISQLVNDYRLSKEDKFQRIAEMIPPAFQYPELTSCKLLIDGKLYESGNSSRLIHTMESMLIYEGKSFGKITVMLGKGSKSELVEFLPEEQALLDSISRAISTLVARTRFERERKELEEQLHHADRLATIGQLAAGVAHELNEPLSNILGFAQLAQKSLDKPEMLEGDIGKIVKAALHSREIVRKLLLFARQMPAQKSAVNLNDVVRENVSLLDNRLKSGGIELRLELEENLPGITADRSQISQVIINLTVNAVQAMPSGGTLTVSTQCDRSAITLQIQDTGTGIAKGIRQKIFMPFFTTKDIGEGTGLGLSVVHGIITAHKGTIEVESESGKGSIFRVKLPCEHSGKGEQS